MMQAAVDGVAITGGEIVANVVAKQIPEFLTETKTGADGTPVKVETQTGYITRKLLAAIAVAIGADFIPGVPRRVKDFAIGGAVACGVKALVRPMLPTDPKNPLTGALSAGGRVVRVASYPTMGSYPSANGRRAIAARTGLRAYPRTLGQDYTTGQGGYVAVPGAF